MKGKKISDSCGVFFIKVRRFFFDMIDLSLGSRLVILVWFWYSKFIYVG